MDWISVKDKLPEKVEGTHYLVMVKHITLSEMEVAEWWFDGDERWIWMWEHNGTVHLEVTHWMPLPEPPK